MSVLLWKEFCFAEACAPLAEAARPDGARREATDRRSSQSWRQPARPFPARRTITSSGSRSFSCSLKLRHGFARSLHPFRVTFRYTLPAATAPSVTRQNGFSLRLALAARRSIARSPLSCLCCVCALRLPSRKARRFYLSQPLLKERRTLGNLPSFLSSDAHFSRYRRLRGASRIGGENEFVVFQQMIEPMRILHHVRRAHARLVTEKIHKNR